MELTNGLTRTSRPQEVVGSAPGPEVAVRLAVDPANSLEDYAATREGLFRSNDGAANFRKTPFPIFAFGTGGTADVAINARLPGTLYVVDLFCALGWWTYLRRTDNGGETSVVTLGSSRIPAVSVDDASILFASTVWTCSDPWTTE